MKGKRRLASTRDDFFTAVQFLTRIPVPAIPYSADPLPRAAKFFPVIGILLGWFASLLYRLLVAHLPRSISSLLVVTFLVLLTGGLHEDAIADAADGLGGGWNREQVLVIFKDSRIGSYGATALVLALFARISLLSSLPVASVFGFLVAARCLSRWSILPLSFYLPSAHATGTNTTDSGQGARIASLTSGLTLLFGTLITVVAVVFVLRRQAIAALVAAALVTLLTGLYYSRRLGGVTGDCFGATVQMVEIAVLFTGVWIA